MALKDQMIRFRAKHNLSQDALASKAGVSKQTIYMIETGQQNPSRRTEQKILSPMEAGKNED